jgi:hypothetical protein
VEAQQRRRRLPATEPHGHAACAEAADDIEREIERRKGNLRRRRDGARDEIGWRFGEGAEELQRQVVPWRL